MAYITQSHQTPPTYFVNWIDPVSREKKIENLGQCGIDHATIVCRNRRRIEKTDWPDLHRDFTARRIKRQVLLRGPDDKFPSVYCIKSGAFLKIGISRNPQKRLADLSVGLPVQPTLLAFREFEDATEVEAYWHQRLHKYRRNGEWFQMPSRLEKKVIDLIQEGAVPTPAWINPNSRAAKAAAKMLEQVYGPALLRRRSLKEGKGALTTLPAPTSPGRSSK